MKSVRNGPKESFLIKATLTLLAPILVWYIANLFWNINEIVEVAVYTFMIVVEVVVVLFLVAGPAIAPYLTSTVKSPKHIWFLPTFSDCENGRSKAIVDAGKNLRRHIMNYNDADFAREGDDPTVKHDETQDEYWEVILKRGNHLNARNWWEEYVERTTGLVFVGIYPFRRVRHAPITLRQIRDVGGKSTLVVTQGRSKEHPAGELSDHVRVREFDWGVQVTVVVNGFYRIRVLVFVRLQSVNPNKMLFGVDNWSESINSSLEGRLIESARGMSVETLMNSEEAANTLVDSLERINEEAEPKIKKTWGLKVIQAKVVDYDLSELKDDQLKALTAVEVSTRNKAAKILDYGAEATGQADVIDQRAQKIKDHGESGRAASEHEAIETAAENGAATLFSGLGSSSSSDNADLLKAILAELKKGSKK